MHILYATCCAVDEEDEREKGEKIMKESRAGIEDWKEKARPKSARRGW